MLRQLVRYTAWMLDHRHHMEVTHLVAMCNYRANRLACEAADRAMQTCGGIGYSRHMPFEHIYRHHRRYRITEGSEEIQMRKVAQQLFGLGGERRRPRPPVALLWACGAVTRPRSALDVQAVGRDPLRWARAAKAQSGPAAPCQTTAGRQRSDEEENHACRQEAAAVAAGPSLRWRWHWRLPR